MTLSVSSRRKYLLIFAMLLIGMAACASSGGDSGGGGGDEGAADMSRTITGLTPGTTYYWKVTAKDDNGGVTDSEVFSFKVVEESAF